MGQNELSFLLHHRVNGNYDLMEGYITFFEQIDVDPRAINNKDGEQKCRDYIANLLVDKVMDWLKEEFPYELQSYVNLAAQDLVKKLPQPWWA